MSRPPLAPPRRRLLLRSSHRCRSEQEALARAYELALPIVRKTISADRSPQNGHPPVIVSQTCIGG
jgi:hypothetical protein